MLMNILLVLSIVGLVLDVVCACVYKNTGVHPTLKNGMSKSYKILEAILIISLMLNYLITGNVVVALVILVESFSCGMNYAVVYDMKKKGEE